MGSRVVKPTNCIFAVGIPTTEAEFREALSRHPSGDFVSRYPVWARYRYSVVLPFLEVVPTFRALGANVATNVSFSMFRELLRTDAKVLTLFAHWIGDAVEFSDGSHTTTEIANLIPEDREGVIDLCVCHPEPLVIALKQRSRLLTVRYVQPSATVDLWLQFYRVLYATLAQRDVDFIMAIEETALGFRRALNYRRNP